MEFAFAMVIFLLCIGIFYNAYPNIKEQSQDPLKEVYFDCKVASEILLSSGLPKNWTTQNVIRPGITNGEHILLEDKVLKFRSLSENNYTKLKSFMGLESEFAFYLLDYDNDIVAIGGNKIFGNLDVNLTANNKIDFTQVKADDIAKIERSLIYKKRPVRLLIVTWN